MRSGRVSTPSRFQTIASARLDTRTLGARRRDGPVLTEQSVHLGSNSPRAAASRLTVAEYSSPSAEDVVLAGMERSKTQVPRDQTVAAQRHLTGRHGEDRAVTVKERLTVTETGTVGVDSDDASPVAGA